MGRRKITVGLLVVVIAVLATLLWPTLYRQYLSPPATAYVQHDSGAVSQARVYRVALTETGQTLFQAGVAEVLKENLVEARAHFEQLVELEPNSAGAYEQLGRVQLLEGERQEAEASFAAAFTLASGDAFMEKTLGRWIKLTRDGHYTLHTDRMIERQFPGQLAHFIEHRAVPVRSGILGASHLLIGTRRMTFPTPTAVPFDILARTQTGHGTVVFGSSRAREGFKPGVFEAALPAAYAPAINFASSQSAPRYWLGVLTHLASVRSINPPGNKGKRLKCAVVLADPESLSDTWSRAFNAPKALEGEAWNNFVATGKGTFEMWPQWTGLTDLGEWKLPSNWLTLARDPFANGLNHARQGTAYVFDGVGENNRDAFVEVLHRLQQIADQVIVVATPLSPFQFELASANSTYPDIARLAGKAGVPFIMRAPREWGLDARHFFGAKGYPLDKMDWWHLNYSGAAVFTRELAKTLTEHSG